MTTDEIASKVALWQGRLRMQDWRFEVAVGRRSKAPTSLGPGCAGCARWDTHERLAYIYLVEADDLGDLDAPYLDMERTLLHEMVHVLFAMAASQDDQQGPGWEQAINAVVDALMTMAAGCLIRSSPKQFDVPKE